MEKISLRSAPAPILAALALCGVLIALGTGLAWVGISDLRAASASARWPTARGLILQSRLREERSAVGRRTRAQIDYRYRVGPVTYASTRVAFATGPAQTSSQVVRRYPTGSEVTVYYKKGAPGISVLEPGGSILTMGLAFYGFSALALLGAGGLCWLVPRIAWSD